MEVGKKGLQARVHSLLGFLAILVIRSVVADVRGARLMVVTGGSTVLSRLMGLILRLLWTVSFLIGGAYWISQLGYRLELRALWCGFVVSSSGWGWWFR